MLDPRKIRTVRQLAQSNPAFTESSLRWLIFNAASNGLAPALVRIGRRVLIDEDRFTGWLEQHRQQPAEPAQAAR